MMLVGQFCGLVDAGHAIEATDEYDGEDKCGGLDCGGVQGTGLCEGQ